MKLFRRRPLFVKEHRSGWPYAMSELWHQDTGHGLMLDDFVDGTWTYLGHRKPHERPWVGIFHHPVKIDSPVRIDRMAHMDFVMKNSFFEKSRKHLRGCIALSPQVGEYLAEKLQVPVTVIKHPTEANVPQWHYSAVNRLWQCGFFLRDTRFIHKLPTKTVMKMRSAPNMPHLRLRDRDLINGDELDLPVWDIEHVDNTTYDAYMISSVMCMRLFGAAANNVVVECIARNTPLIVNRLPEVEFYLGANYPLYYENQAYLHAAQLAEDAERIVFASEELSRLDKTWLDAKQFAQNVMDFMKGL